jgi:hypothetical protein
MNRLHRPGGRPRNPARTEPARLGGRPDVHINIRELSLQGFSRAEQQRFMQALADALGQPTAGSRDWSAWSSQDFGSLPPLQVRRGGTVEDSARLLARDLFACLAGNHAGRGHG